MLVGERIDIDMRSLPKVELHRHLEGAIRPATILDLFRTNRGEYLGTQLPEILPRIQITGSERSLADFLAKFEFFMPCIRTASDISRITAEAIEDCVSDGIVYAELRFSPAFIRRLTGLSYSEAVEAVLEGARGAGPAIPVNFTLIVPQPEGERVAWDTVRLAADYLSNGVTGVDIADDTRALGLEEYVRPMAWARANGLGVTVHAGEAEGPLSVRVAVEQLGATRIGHGVRSIEDDRVIEMLVDRGTLLEICPTSNVHTQAAPSIREHPLPRLIERGVPVCLNTDDPGISDITLTGEYELVHETFGLSRADLALMNVRAARCAFAGDEQRAALMERLGDLAS
jgi:adenosine deaminase